MGRMVIVGCRPKTGQDDGLLALTREHVQILRRLGLATERPALAMRTKDGVIIEVFEWADGGIEKAHKHPDVLAMWEKYAAVCDYVRLSELSESKDLFAEFEPIDL